MGDRRGKWRFLEPYGSFELGLPSWVMIVIINIVVILTLVALLWVVDGTYPTAS